VSTKPPTTPPTSRTKPSALSVVKGGVEVGELKPEPSKAELLLERYESRTFSGAAVLDGMPRPEWLVRGLLLRNSLAAVFGPKGQGKTHYTLALALELARGGEWNGRKLLAAPVLYLVGEGSPSFVERLEAWQEFHQEPLPEMFHSAHLEPVPQLVEPSEMKALSELVKRRFGTTTTNGLVVLDTFQTATVGLDEISGRDVTLALEELQGLRRATGSTVLVVHHAGKDLGKGQRGHSSLGASMETELEITKASGSTTVKAKLVKMRAAADGSEREYKLNYVMLEPTLEDKAEALALGEPAEMRSVPVLTELENVGVPNESRLEKVLVAMLESYDIAEGLKRADAEQVLNVKRSTAGEVLKALKEKAYATNESPYTQRTTSSYWLTDSGRSVAESVLRRRAGALVEQATNGEEAW
jgi:hypothetical protein